VDIVTLGELLIDMFPGEAGRHIGEVESFTPKPGGAPANVAVAAARLGASSAFIGKVGDDLFGHYLKTKLEEEGVDTRGIRFDGEARTTMAVIAMPDEHSAEYVFYRNPGADQRLRHDELDQDLLRETRAFHFGSISLTHEPARAATLAALELARGAEALISYDVNYRPSLWRKPAGALNMARAILPRVDILKVNEHEAALLAGVEALDFRDLERVAAACQRLRARGPSIVMVTLGEHGSYFQAEAGGGYAPPFRVDAVDAVGCGDAFTAAVLVRLLDGPDWRSNCSVARLAEILRYANAVGALTSLSRGAIPAMPSAAQVDDFLQQHRTNESMNFR
jgi:fructokinase